MGVASLRLSVACGDLGANFCRAPSIGDVAPTSMLIRRRASRNLARSNKNGRGEKMGVASLRLSVACGDLGANLCVSSNFLPVTKKGRSLEVRAAYFS